MGIATNVVDPKLLDEKLSSVLGYPVGSIHPELTNPESD
jgi:hypothetical protein